MQINSTVIIIKYLMNERNCEMSEERTRKREKTYNNNNNNVC